MEITTTSEYAISNDKKKKIKTLQGTTAALIKQVFLETSAVVYQKLKFIGVGYRTYRVPNSGDKLLLFRLGYSHPIYFKIPKNIKIFCLKLTKLFISGNSYKKCHGDRRNYKNHVNPQNLTRVKASCIMMKEYK